MKLSTDYTGFPNNDIELNPMQELIVPYIDEFIDRNLIVAAPTASGKSTVPKMLGKHVLDSGKNIIYIGIMKALAEEKADDWAKDNWAKYPQATITSDFRVDPGYEQKIKEARIVCITPESLASRIRKTSKGDAPWLDNAGLLVIDECLPPEALIDTEIGKLPIGHIIDNNLDVKVASYNHETNKVEYKKILAKEKVLRDKTWYSIYYGKTVLRITSNHRVWVKDRGYIHAEELQKGDKLLVSGLNPRGEKFNFWNAIGGWLRFGKPTQEICQNENFTINSTEEISYVEISNIKKIGSNTAERYGESRVRRYANSIFDVILQSVYGSLRYCTCQWQKRCEPTMACEYRPSYSSSGMVYGRWFSKQESMCNQHRGVFNIGGQSFSRMVEKLLGYRLQSIYDKKSSSIAANKRGQRKTSSVNTPIYVGRHGIQVVTKNGGNILLNVWNKIHNIQKTFWFNKVFNYLLQYRMSAKAEAYAGTASGAENKRWCCDLEIEDNNNFFANGVLVHNCHLIGDGSRGANLEAAIIEFCHQHPNCRVIGLSATMPNVQQVARWIETLTGKTTDVVSSTYRPVPIEEHFIPYTPASKAKTDVEEAKTNIVCKLVTHPEKINEQFLVAVFNKSYGRSLLQELKNIGVSAEFHNADIGDRSKKKQIEDNFKAGRIRVLISTSTLFTGVNLPARNVIITAVEAAQQDVPVYTLKQAAGRAGRPKYDTEGDVFYLIPSARQDYHVERIENGEAIKSQLSSRTMLAIHVVGAIYLKRINNQNEFYTWYKHTLAFEQGVRNETAIELIRQNVIESLNKMGVVYTKKDENDVDTYSLSRVGIISAQMYLDPYHYVSALLAIKKYSLLDNPTEQDFIRAMCMWDGYQTQSISYDEKLALPSNIPAVPDGYKKIAAVIKFRISGEKIPMQFISMNAMLYNDIARMHVAVERALNESKTGIQLSPERLDAMFARVISQCSWEQANLAVAKFTKREREKLNAQGIYTVSQAKNNVALTNSVIGEKRATDLGVGQRSEDGYGVTRFGKK